MDDLLDDMDATGLATVIRAGEVSAAEVVEHAARRIEQRDPEINAVVQRRLDEAVDEARTGVSTGPLMGVPFVIKDLGADVAGLASTQGSRLFADAIAERDSELVARYRRAGLIVMGKTNTPEFGKNASTEPLLYGPTRNPHAPSRSAGGSSGGTAAAVAAGMVAAGHGNDGGGSLRIPAAACGLVGLKPTRGRTPGRRAGGALSAPASVDHAITSSVRDTALLLDIAGGPLPGSGYAAPYANERYVDEVGRDPGRCRVAVSTVRPDGVAANAQVVGPVTRAAHRLADLGHEVTEASPDFPNADLMAGFSVALSLPTVIEIDARLEALGRELREEDLEPFTRVLYDHGRAVSGTDAIRGWQALERAGQAVGAFFTGYDVLLTPTLAEPVPELGYLDTTDVAAMYQRAGIYSAFTSFGNVTGQPAISLPLGQDEAGVPVGVQLVGAFGREDLLLRLASQLLEEGPATSR